MQNNPDLKALINMLNSGYLSQTVNNLKKALQIPEPQGETNPMPADTRQTQAGNNAAHVDPKINLLLSIIPLLPGEKQKQAENMLKPLNLLFFVQRYVDILNKSGS